MRHSGFAFLYAGVLLLWSGAATAQQKIDLDSPEGYVQAVRKMHCSLRDGKSSVFSWQGHAYSRVPGERDRKLFAVEGMNVRQCEARTDPKLGVGYRMVSREIMLYKDPETGEVLRTWTNPWTGKELEVIHVANDPVNQPATFGRKPDGSVRSLGLVMYGKTFFRPLEIPLFYPNPLGGDYQQQVGSVYHSAEIFDFSGNIDDLRNARKDTAQVNVAWMRMAPWLPWMDMGDRVGMMYFNAVGGRLPSWRALSATLRQEIRNHYPEYRQPPPLDDQRRNETSWTYFKKVLDQRRAREKQESGRR